MAKKLTAKKAKKIIRHGSVRGRKLTERQGRFMGWVAGGRKKPKKRRRR